MRRWLLFVLVLVSVRIFAQAPSYGPGPGTNVTPGGTSGQTQYNNAGAFAGYTMSGDGTIVPSTGVLTISKINGTTPGGSCTNQAITSLTSSAVPTCTTLTSAYVNNSIALTGTDINTTNQVTATHLASPLPIIQGGTATATPSLVAGTNVTVTGSWPNQTVNSTASGGGGNCNSGTAMCYYPKNDASGTTVNKIAKWVSLGGNNGTVGTAATTDSALGVFLNFAGIVVTGAGTTGQATVAYSGTVSCQFDSVNAPTKGDSVQVSATVAGACSDLGATPANANPDSHLIFAVVEASASAGAITTIDILPVTPGYGNIVGTNLMQILATSTYGGIIAVPSSLYQVGATNNNSDLLIRGGPYGFRIGDPSTSSFYWRFSKCGGGSTCGAGSHDALFDIQASSWNGDDAARFTGNMYAVPKAFGTTSGTITLDAGLADEQTATLNGNATIAVTSGAPQNPGAKFTVHLCQDATGGRTLTWPSKMVGAGVMPAAANACMTQQFIYNDSGTSGVPAVAPASPITVVSASQTALISTTTIATPINNSEFRLSASVNCTTASASAVATVTLSYTDTSSTVQSPTLAATCTTLGVSSVADYTHTIRVKGGTNITYAVAITNTPTYDLFVGLETLAGN